MSAGGRPNLFIVGAPKCGSGSLWRYLAGHPQVFMSPLKEPNHFGSDVRTERTVNERADYLALFREAGDAPIVGEASVRYLRSRDAAAEIAVFDPAARIIVMVREPVAQMRSLHNHFTGRGIEDLEFEVAVEAGTERFRGRVTGAPLNPDFLDYRRAARYAEQLERYRAVFPPAQIHVIVQEEFARDTPAVFRDLLGFLGIDDTYQPSFERHNVARRARSPRLMRWLVAPPAVIGRIGRRLLPPLIRKRIWHDRIRTPLFQATSVAEPPMPIDPDLEARLRAEYAPEVDRLADLIDRPDLPALWGYR
ncbi:MAG: sulfotransferase [Chloroflexi bacterium]|nr:sulfotransferase [Chloroflexota bacterium]